MSVLLSVLPYLDTKLARAYERSPYYRSGHVEVEFTSRAAAERVLDRLIASGQVEHGEIMVGHRSNVVRDYREEGHHAHRPMTARRTHEDEHGTRTVYTCSCGAYRVIERPPPGNAPGGAWSSSPWQHREEVLAG